MDPVGQISDLTTPKEFQVSLHGQVLPPASSGTMPSPPTSDTDRFMCIVYLLIDVGSKVLRRLFQYHVVTPTCTFDQHLVNNRKIINSLRRLLNSSQMDIMFPPNGNNSNLDDYDITLLTALLINIVPSLGYQEMNLVKGLRDYRNKLYRQEKSCKMNASDFQIWWNEISSTLITLTRQCGDPDFETEILKEIQQTHVPNASSGTMPFPPTSDTDRFMCIVYMLIDVGSKVLRRLFQYHVVTPTCALDQYLAINRWKIDRLPKNRWFNSFQMDILFPPNGDNTNLDYYDIPLLSALFSNIVPSLGHQTVNMVTGLRIDRNNLLRQARSCKINASDFQTCWNRISSTLITLSQQCGDPDFETEILKEIQQTHVPDVPIIPMEILHMDERSLQVYKKALRDGKEKVYNIRVMVVGHYGVGKTTLIKRLLEQEVVISDRKSTEGIDVHKHCCKVVLATGEWTVQLEAFDQHARFQRLVKFLTGQPERPVVSSKQDGQMDVIYKREIPIEDFYVPVHDIDDDDDDADDTETRSVLGTAQNAVNSKQIENPSLVKADQNQETGKSDATIEILRLVNENADKLKKSMEEFAALSVWDFAGQSIFYTTHQTFLTCRAIYLLVTDLSKKVTDLVKDDDYFIDASGVPLCQVQDLVEIWFNSIHCCTSSPTDGTLVTSPVDGSTVTPHADDTTPVTPPVILVGTHVDKIDKDKRQEVASRYFEQICHILKDKPTSLHLMGFVAIDNTHVDPELKILKDKIFELAKKQPYWGEEVPTNWLPLEEVLMKLKASGEKVIPRHLLEKLNEAASVPITAEQLDLFLRFQHEIGTILYFNVKGLREKIVLDPQWLIDALKSLITEKMFILKEYPTIRDLWFEFSEKGKLTSKLIDTVWSNKPEFHDNKEHILLLMEKLNVIAKPRSCIEELKEESYYLAPCMIRDAAPKGVICPGENTQLEKTSLLCFEFTGKFLPPPVFHRLLAACVSQWQIATQGDKAQIFCGCCIFDLDHDRQHRLTLYFRNYIIFVRVTRMGVRDMYKSSKICAEARTFISETLTRIIGNLGQSLKFELYVKCPDSDADNSKGLIPVSLLQKEENAVCHAHDTSHTLASQELLKFWFQKEDQSGDGDVSPSTSKAEERENFSRISCLLVDIGTKVLRRLLTFHAVSPTCTIAVFMKNNEETIKRLKKERILSRPQFEEIFPMQGNTDQRKYDISLTSALLLNLVPKLDSQIRTAICEVRSDRNKYQAHTSSARMKSSDFTTHWARITRNLICLSKGCSDPVFEDEMVDEIKGIENSGQQDLQSRISKCEENIQILYSRGDPSD